MRHLLTRIGAPGLSLVGVAALLVGCDRIHLYDTGPDLPCPIPPEAVASPPADAVAFTLDNQACTTLCWVALSPHVCDDWGGDWIGDRNVPSGESVTLQVPPGLYDLMIEDCTEEPAIFERLDLTQDVRFPIYDADADGTRDCGASLTVVNDSPTPICHMWIEWTESQFSERFGDKWLGEEQIAPGESRTFVVRPAHYNIKAEGCEWEQLRIEMDVPVQGPLVWTVSGRSAE